jgi:GTP-dependent phosphoenolpyruvate carboxykinase
LAINTRYGKKKLNNLNILQFFGYMLELNREIFKGNWLKFANKKTKKKLFFFAFLLGKKKKKKSFWGQLAKFTQGKEKKPMIINKKLSLSLLWW